MGTDGWTRKTMCDILFHVWIEKCQSEGSKVRTVTQMTGPGMSLVAPPQ